MTDDELRQTVLRILGNIAPEADMAGIVPHASFREQLDLDSMDFYNFALAVDKELHIGIPERDYSKLTSLNDCVEYLKGRRSAE